jgi:DNA-binding XRE family transcriptional regulator
LSQVNKNGPIIRLELGPCWLWTGYRNEDGYGQIEVNGRQRPAHQIALELVGWIVPAEFLQVLHRCDNPPCVNPAHLRIGTAQDDADDRVSKGRQLRGECNGRAKLTQAVVDEIRRLYSAGGWTKSALAKRFGVSDVTIGNIIAGRTWKHAA